MNTVPATRRKVFHIFADYPHHSVRMIDFLSEVEAVLKNSTFFVAASDEQTRQRYAAITGVNIVFYEKFKDQIEELYKDPDAVFVFHSLFDYEQWLQINTRKIIQRSVWVSWGADIYKHLAKAPANEPFKWKVKRYLLLWLKRFSMKKLRAIIALNQGDADVIERTFWARGLVSVLRYPLDDSTYDYAEPKATSNAQETPTYDVFCGNSADPSNNHIQMLEALAHLDTVRIHMPLNYGGDDAYVETVCAKGKSLFGDRFKPILSFMQKDDYDNLLARMDVGVFFHDRQQGLYVAFTFLLHGKPMYIREAVSSYQEFLQLGMHVGNADLIAETQAREFAELPASVAKSNAEIARRTFTIEPVKQDWIRFLNDLTAEKP
ncbi:MAG: TDP-N-acetylfucosamine:lipid II N-acetylfucosaminyltransferase [Woeseiaceae bacterium]